MTIILSNTDVEECAATRLRTVKASWLRYIPLNPLVAGLQVVNGPEADLRIDVYPLSARFRRRLLDSHSVKFLCKEDSIKVLLFSRSLYCEVWRRRNSETDEMYEPFAQVLWCR